MNEQLIGVVSHYWGKISVAGIDLTDGDLSVGDEIHIKGVHDDFTQKVESMQIDMQDVETAKKGESVGIKVIQKAHEHDKVYKIIPE